MLFEDSVQKGDIDSPGTEGSCLCVTLRASTGFSGVGKGRGGATGSWKVITGSWTGLLASGWMRLGGLGKTV